MWNLPSKKLTYISFYYFFIIFWAVCVVHDVVAETITGFTFGYLFAMFYFIARTRAVITDLERLNEDKEPED